jgi:hypothetical protein
LIVSVLKAAKPKTLAQSVAELEKNPIIANMLAELKKKKKKFDPSKIGTTTKHKIGRATFLEETQRLVIPNTLLTLWKIVRKNYLVLHLQL